MVSDDVNARCDAALAAIAQGNADAISEIYDCLGSTVYSVAYGVCRNREDAEDVLQETLIGALTNADKYLSGSNARAWLLTMAHNRSVDLVRRRRRFLPVDGEEACAVPDADNPFEVVEVLDLLRPLKPEERTLVLLHLYAGLQYEEIAVIMSISVDAAQKRYQRALRKLRDTVTVKEESKK